MPVRVCVGGEGGGMVVHSWGANHKIMQELGISPETEFTSLMLPSK